MTEVIEPPLPTTAPSPVIAVRRVDGPPVVAVRVWISGGARRETAIGQALIAGRLLAEGTARSDFRQIAEQVESRGFSLSSFGSYEIHGLALDGLAADWEWALEQAADVLLEAAFPADRGEWLARQAAAELDSLGDQPQVRTAWGFAEQLYTPNRRRLPVQGGVEELAALTVGDCRSFHRAALAEGPLIVTVTGAIDEGQVHRRLETLFSSAVLSEVIGPSGAEGDVLEDSAAPVGLPERRRQVYFESGSGDQAHLLLGHLTVARDHPDFDALDLLSVILGSGAGLTGRIPDRIREQEGLAYTTSAHMASGAGLDPGRLVAYVGTSTATVAQAERGVREELARVIDDGIRDDELESARSYLLGRLPFGRETARQWADLLAMARHWGLPFDRPGWREENLRRIDRPAVEEAARRHLRSDDLRVTVGLPAT
ncbi:MAG: pitrilysin family protein [Acidobacteriota bacterium]